MKFSAADAVDLGTAFGAGTINDSATALVEISDGILDLTLCFTLYTISFYCFLQKFTHEQRSFLSIPPETDKRIIFEILFSLFVLFS